MRLQTLIVAAILSAAAIAWWGCDSAPGPARIDNRPPLVRDLVFSPDGVNLDDPGAPATDASNRVSVPLALSVQATDPDGAVADVRFALQAPGAPAPYIAEGSLERREGDRFALSETLMLDAGRTGAYTLYVYAIDDEGRLGNQVRGSILLTNTGSPPVVESVTASPDPIKPPFPITFVLTAQVSDPDGLANIARVVVTTPSGGVFLLVDNGTRGDAKADDGLFTASFDVPEAAPGVQRFEVQAFDRSGLASSVVVKEVTVE